MAKKPSAKQRKQRTKFKKAMKKCKGKKGSAFKKCRRDALKK